MKLAEQIANELDVDKIEDRIRRMSTHRMVFGQKDMPHDHPPTPAEATARCWTEAVLAALGDEIAS